MSHAPSKKVNPVLINDGQNTEQPNKIPQKATKQTLNITKVKSQASNVTKKASKLPTSKSTKGLDSSQQKVKQNADTGSSRQNSESGTSKQNTVSGTSKQNTVTGTNKQNNSEPASSSMSTKSVKAPNKTTPETKGLQNTYKAINKALGKMELSMTNFSSIDENLSTDKHYSSCKTNSTLDLTVTENKSGGDRGNHSESINTTTFNTDLTDADSIFSRRFVYEDQLSVVASQMKQVLQDLKLNLINIKKHDQIEDYEKMGKTLEAEFKKSVTSSKKSKTDTSQQKSAPKSDAKKIIKPGTPNSSPNNTNEKPKTIRSQSRPTSRQSARPTSPQQKRRATSLPPKPKKPYDFLNSMNDLKRRAADAVRDRKVFTCIGQWDAVKKALTQRGWVELIHIDARSPLSIRRYMAYSINELFQLMRFEELHDICQRVILSKLVEGHTPKLYWVHRYIKVPEGSVINKFRRDVFSYASKGGLCEGSKQEYWWRIPDIAGINHPRTYLMSVPSDQQSFIKDYRITAAMSLLKWIVKVSEKKEQKVISTSGKISPAYFNFAVMECYKYIKRKTHDDIDTVIVEASDHEWKSFLEAFYKIMYIGNHFKKDKTTEAEMIKKSTYLIKYMEEYWPYLQMDGWMNLWILKPMNSSMGIGIVLCRELNYILNIVKKDKKRNYIVQKYIERPFLIHNTKFDIRQYFLISCANPLTIWMYKSCYLRFCSQTYNLHNLHEAIHLTNNSVQKKYMRPVYDPALPSYLMWTSDQFQKYLENIGFPDVYKKIIYTEMKKCFTAAVLMLHNKIDRRPTCFELYGADFVITEDFKAWLIEINSNPALFSSTPVTKTICPKVLEDVVKVVIDHAKNPSAPTGGFELIYKQKEKHFEKTKLNLKLSGMPAPKEYFANSDSELKPMKETKPEPVSKIDKIKEAKESLETFGTSLKDTLESLQQLIKQEKMRNMFKKSESTETVLTQRSVQATNCNLYEEFYGETHKDNCVSSSLHNLEQDAVTKSLLTLLNVIKTEKYNLCQRIPERARSLSPKDKKK